MNIKSIISKIKNNFNVKYLTEKDLKNLLSKYFQINYKNFQIFCEEQNVMLTEHDLWNFFCSQNISIHVSMIKAAYLMDDSEALVVVTGALTTARNDINNSAVQLKICRVK